MVDAATDPRSLLLADRERTTQRLERLRHQFNEFVAASRDTNADDEHDPEGATIAFERSQGDALVQQTDRHLAEIDGALARVEAGTYGRCGVCGQLIPQARLQARPTARTDVGCA